MRKLIVMLSLLLVLPAVTVFAAPDTTVTKMGPAPSTITGSLDGEVLDIGNGDLGDANTSYLYFGLLKAGFNAFSLQYTVQATTLTIEISNDLPDVANASAVWTDVTLVATDGAAATITATGSLTVAKSMPWSRVRIKRLTTNATNALKMELTRMRLN